tara:strand:+ start:179 stop:454 length:276 start_codon:yes stop_codon:yes gene_type:complete
MAFTYTLTSNTVMGNKRIAIGTFTNSAGGTGGEVVTGLNRVDFMTLTTTGTIAAPGELVVNETLPLESGSVTIVTSADIVGVWMAIGDGVI